MNNPVSWFDIYVQDMARARTFYEKTLAVELTKMPVEEAEMWGFPMNDQVYGAGGALVKMDEMAPGVGGTLVYLTCEECGAAAERAAANGGRLVKEKFSIGQEGFVALVMDSEGNMIGLHSYQ